MSDQTIYRVLRAEGLSPAGACAMMGNMCAESGLVSFRVQGDYKSPYEYSRSYTAQVDNDSISKDDFVYHGPNGGGYGLCQWTYYPRKADLYDYAKSMGVSIGDETMQCDFCAFELQRDFADLFFYLCETDDLPGATKRICSEYEMPAINNFADRINYATKYYNELAGTDPGDIPEDPPEITPAPGQTEETCQINIRILRRGNKGRDVFLLQCGLTDMGFDSGIPDGDFGPKTESAVKDMQKLFSLDQTGVADWFVWQTIFQ